MIDGDDKLSRRYGELPKEEPRAALDEAILASARRAVAPKSLSQRWAVPVSLAAVLVLALGITLRMQVEEPGIETSAPSSAPRTPPPASSVDAPAAPAPVAKDAAAGAAPEKAQLQKKQAPAAERDEREQRRDRAATPAGIVHEKAVAEESAAPEKKANVDKGALDANVASESPKPQPKAFADAAQRPAPATSAAPAATRTAPAAAPAPPPAERFEAQPSAPSQPAAPAMAARPQAMQSPSAVPQDALRAKREASVGAAGLAKEDAKDPLTKELERIAQLRREGRHREADEALEKFRKENPSYKIPDALWEQVKPR